MILWLNIFQSCYVVMYSAKNKSAKMPTCCEVRKILGKALKA